MNEHEEIERLTSQPAAELDHEARPGDTFACEDADGCSSEQEKLRTAIEHEWSMKIQTSFSTLRFISNTFLATDMRARSNSSSQGSQQNYNSPARVSPDWDGDDNESHDQKASLNDGSSSTRNLWASGERSKTVSSDLGEWGRSKTFSIDKLGYRQRAEEFKKMKVIWNTFRFNLACDLLELITKSAAFASMYIRHQLVQRELVIQACLLLVAVGLLAFAMTWRVSELRSLAFLAKNGYAKHWNIQDRLAKEANIDPRVHNDQCKRDLRDLQLRSLQAMLGDLPWVVSSVMFATFGSLKVDFWVLSAIAGSGCSFGMKFSRVVELFKMYLSFGGAHHTQIYQNLPAEIKIGIGMSWHKTPDTAIEEAYGKCVGMLGVAPTFMIVIANADFDSGIGLLRLSELAPDIPFVGGTTCQGVMCGQRSYRQEFAVAVWALFDPEGHYATEIWQHPSGASEQESHAMKAGKRIRRAHTALAPSFVFMMSAPGAEEQVLAGLAKGLHHVPVIGGSSADNDITGKWTQWASVPGDSMRRFRMEQNGCCLCGVWCSAKVQSLLFTGYNATGKIGTITKTDGPRHILEIDHKPAAQVYNEWTGREFDHFLSLPGDSVILAEASLYPLGQICGLDSDDEPIYRSIHPHLLVKNTQSVTVFSDVSIGEGICMMSGTKENIVNRIAGVATHIVRHSDFALPEVRGSIIFFCAGAMMYASDHMDVCASKLFTSLGGTPYIGVHTFGEQGQFVDGQNRHGNLMFSALTFSSKRRQARLLNADTGKVVNEDSPEFQDILLEATICE